MVSESIYLYFGDKKSAAGNIYHEKQADFFKAKFIDISAYGKFFQIFSNLFSQAKYNSLVNRFFLAMIADQFLKFFVSALLFFYKRNKKKKLFVVSNDYVSIYYCLWHKIFLCNQIHLSCHDLPWTFYHNYFSKRLNLFSYKYLIQKFDSFDFTSPKMKEVLEQKYNLSLRSYFITYSGIDLISGSILKDQPVSFKKNNISLKKKYLNLLYLGSIRFKDELRTLCEYMDQNNIRYNADCFSSVNPMIDGMNYLGFCNNINNIDFRKYDFGIVPLSFSTKDRDLVETSFPGKTSVYLSRSLPLICISPEYSALNSCMKKFNIGISYKDLMNKYKKSFDIKPYREFIKKNHANFF